MKKLLRYPLIILFTLIVFGFTVLDTFTHDKSYSQLENRVLVQRPNPTLEKIISNEYTKDYEEYIDDQILGRDEWIDIKSRVEFILAKVENNGIIYGTDHYLFEKYKIMNETRLNKNVNFIMEFIKDCKYPVTFGIIPNSYMKNQDKLPYGLDNLNQYTYINDIDDKIKKINNNNGKETEILNLNDLNLKYYKTDHHWTTQGAYIAYEQLMKQYSLPIISVEQLSEFKKVEKDFYGSYFNKCKVFNAEPDIITYYDIPIERVTIDGKDKNGIYDFSKLKSRDKYGMFLYGNNGITKIISNNKINKTDKKTKILIIKDSYANCFTPFLTYNFDEVTVIDLRSIGVKLSDYLNENEFDKVLILYNFKSLANDVNIAKIIF
ncbi:DHHW family protein [Anaerovorax odorimutans]|uniref:DHHW family protein n=1 Tax=Anaerovorax odorimutans TaxID=109327 RepID=UPI0003FE6AF2|nr:DHHW family protein [Anaerovorax odorimutans]